MKTKNYSEYCKDFLEFRAPCHLLSWAVWKWATNSLSHADNIGTSYTQYYVDTGRKSVLNQSIIQSINQSINQSIGRSIDQPINQSFLYACSITMKGFWVWFRNLMNSYFVRDEPTWSHSLGHTARARAIFDVIPHSGIVRPHPLNCQHACLLPHIHIHMNSCAHTAARTHRPQNQSMAHPGARVYLHDSASICEVIHLPPPHANNHFHWQRRQVTTIATTSLPIDASRPLSPSGVCFVPGDLSSTSVFFFKYFFVSIFVMQFEAFCRFSEIGAFCVWGSIWKL